MGKAKARALYEYSRFMFERSFLLGKQQVEAGVECAALKGAEQIGKLDI